jgi:hypothetical protein
MQLGLPPVGLLGTTWHEHSMPVQLELSRCYLPPPPTASTTNLSPNKLANLVRLTYRTQLRSFTWLLSTSAMFQQQWTTCTAQLSYRDDGTTRLFSHHCHNPRHIDIACLHRELRNTKSNPWHSCHNRRDIDIACLRRELRKIMLPQEHSYRNHLDIDIACPRHALCKT